MLNCYLFEMFYLHYALCDFDSMLLHYAKLFIRQSIDREQIFDVTFEPPIEKSCLRHCLRATHLLSKKCRSGGEPLARLCPIRPAQELILKPPTSERKRVTASPIGRGQFLSITFVRENAKRN